MILLVLYVNVTNFNNYKLKEVDLKLIRIIILNILAQVVEGPAHLLHKEVFGTGGRRGIGYNNNNNNISWIYSYL